MLPKRLSETQDFATLNSRADMKHEDYAKLGVVSITLFLEQETVNFNLKQPFIDIVFYILHFLQFTLYT